jgi:endonuclease YncB( thermonuclease family)
MRSVKEHRKKAASRARKPKTAVLSTSEARANFAEALETAQVDNALIGFDRYGRTVAALVPVEAIYMLAGLGKLVDPATRKEIEEGAIAFAHNVPYRSMSPEKIAAAAPKAKAAKPRGGKSTAVRAPPTVRKPAGGRSKMSGG